MQNPACSHTARPRLKLTGAFFRQLELLITAFLFYACVFSTADPLSHLCYLATLAVFLIIAWLAERLTGWKGIDMPAYFLSIPAALLLTETILQRC